MLARSWRDVRAAWVGGLILGGVSFASPSDLPDSDPPAPRAGATQVSLKDGALHVAWWNEAGRPRYTVYSSDASRTVTRDSDFRLLLRGGAFDPLTSAVSLPASLTRDDSELRIVQFWTQALPEYRDELEKAGAVVRHALANQSFIVSASPAARDAIVALPFVRWVGPYQPAYRLPEELASGIADGSLPATARYEIQIAGKGPLEKFPVADEIESIGGNVEACYPEGFVIEATLTPQQLLQVARLDGVIYVNPWLPPTLVMDNVRSVGGAQYVETIAGYDGTGVRAEVLDLNLILTHQDFAHRLPLVHGARSGDTWHGTRVFGIVFGSGAGNAMARGMLPNAQGIFASVAALGNRYVQVGQLVTAPYFAVFQTNSWGSCCTTGYVTQSATLDDIIFDNDIVLLHGQGNQGTASSLAEAWAKNCIAVGGISHQNTADLGDDFWLGGASIGPATDGRIKPDLVFWYDAIFTTSNDHGYTSDFLGTSASTPAVAGHFGLFFQMWSDGIFGNPVNDAASVFENRSHMSTARAMLINTAQPYPIVGGDLIRTHQGWGLPDLRRLFDRRGSMFIVDESDVLVNLQTRRYLLRVAPGAPELRATLSYLDPAGLPASSRHRVNDLSLKVTSPAGVVYWGNNGLSTSNVSTPGGAPNVVDVIENVWLPSPAAGLWQVEVQANEIVQDGHVETTAVDADYALVVSGILPPQVQPGDTNCDGVVSVSDIGAFVLALTDPAGYASAFPACAIVTADLNGDGGVTVSDIAPFVASLVN